MITDMICSGRGEGGHRSDDRQQSGGRFGEGRGSFGGRGMVIQIQDASQ